MHWLFLAVHLVARALAFRPADREYEGWQVRGLDPVQQLWLR